MSRLDQKQKENKKLLQGSQKTWLEEIEQSSGSISHGWNEESSNFVTPDTIVSKNQNRNHSGRHKATLLNDENEILEDAASQEEMEIIPTRENDSGVTDKVVGKDDEGEVEIVHPFEISGGYDHEDEEPADEGLVHNDLEVQKSEQFDQMSEDLEKETSMLVTEEVAQIHDDDDENILVGKLRKQDHTVTTTLIATFKGDDVEEIQEVRTSSSYRLND